MNDKKKKNKKWCYYFGIVFDMMIFWIESGKWHFVLKFVDFYDLVGSLAASFVEG